MNWVDYGLSIHIHPLSSGCRSLAGYNVLSNVYPQAAGQRGSVQDAEARAEAREPRPGGHGPEDEAAPAGARGRGHGALHPPGPHTPPPLHQDRGHPAPAPSQGEQCC